MCSGCSTCTHTDEQKFAYTSAYTRKSSAVKGHSEARRKPNEAIIIVHTVVKHCSGQGRLGPCREQRLILATAEQAAAQPSAPAQHAADQPVSETPEPQAPVTAMLEDGTATDGPAVKVEERAQPLQPAGSSEHASKDATITSRLDESEALQYRHLMLKSLLYQRRGVRYVAVMA